LDFPQQLAAIAKAMGCNYTVKGEPIAHEQVFSPTGLLPAIMRRADQLSSFCLGYGLGLTFERSENALLNVVVQWDSVTPVSLRLLCATDVLYEFLHQAPSQASIPLDDLMND
jgi:intracellular multiplication protein IcmS